MAHYVENAAQARAYAGLIETQGFTRLVDEHRHAAFGGARTQRAIPNIRIDDHRSTECHRDIERLRVIEIGPNLGEVGAIDSARMQIDSVICLGHDLIYEEVGESRGNRAFGASRKGSVEVTPVRQVA